VPITASHGCAELPHEADDVSSALRLADERLYAHKRMRTARSLEVAPNSMLVGREVASL
jgi:predicted signal transduction protein with EAL and GGDEF domain